MIGIPLGLLYANLTEWLVHKHVLHGLGKKPGSFWSFHWHEHHRAARKLGHEDPAYRKPLGQALRERNAQAKEALSLAAGALAITPLVRVAPFFVATVWFSTVRYYRVHRRAHLDPAWARTHLPWHYDHHMGPNQDANWCVTWPLFDHVLGTREPYLSTERAARDDARRAARAAPPARGASIPTI